MNNRDIWTINFLTSLGTYNLDFLCTVFLFFYNHESCCLIKIPKTPVNEKSSCREVHGHLGRVLLPSGISGLQGCPFYYIYLVLCKHIQSSLVSKTGYISPARTCQVQGPEHALGQPPVSIQAGG